MKRSALTLEVGELALVAAGAIPGALLRWQLESLGNQWLGGMRGAAESDLIANLLGSFCIGLLVAIRTPRPRLVLFVAIGFCGSLTTFSSWMLQLARAFSHGHGIDGLVVLSVSLVGGLVAVAAGFAVMRLGERCFAIGKVGARR